MFSYGLQRIVDQFDIKNPSRDLFTQPRIDIDYIVTKSYRCYNLHLLHKLVLLARTYPEVYPKIEELCVDPDVKTHSGITPLYLAIVHRDTLCTPEVVDLLLKSNANPNITPRNESRCMVGIAIYHGASSLIEPLIARGAKLSEMMHPLHVAAKKNDIVSIQILLNHGIPITQVNGDSYSAVIQSTVKGHLEITKYLLEHGPADWVNYRTGYGNTALNFAAWYGHVKVAKLLIDHGANIENRNSSFLTPLMMATKRDQLKTLKFFILAGAKLDTSELATIPTKCQLILTQVKLNREYMRGSLMGRCLKALHLSGLIITIESPNDVLQEEILAHGGTVTELTAETDILIRPLITETKLRIVPRTKELLILTQDIFIREYLCVE